MTTVNGFLPLDVDPSTGGATSLKPTTSRSLGKTCCSWLRYGVKTSVAHKVQIPYTPAMAFDTLQRCSWSASALCLLHPDAKNLTIRPVCIFRSCGSPLQDMLASAVEDLKQERGNLKLPIGSGCVRSWWSRRWPH